MLLIHEAGNIDVRSAFYVLSKLPKLKTVLLTFMNSVTQDLVEILCNKKVTPFLESVALACRGVDPFTEGLNLQLCVFTIS